MDTGRTADICVVWKGEEPREAVLLLETCRERGAACLQGEADDFEKAPDSRVLVVCLSAPEQAADEAVLGLSEGFYQDWLSGKKDRKKAAMAVLLCSSMEQEALQGRLARCRVYRDQAQLADWILTRTGVIRSGTREKPMGGEASKALMALQKGYVVGDRYELDRPIQVSRGVRVFTGRSLKSGKPRIIKAVDRDSFHRQFYTVLSITREIREEEIPVQRVLKIMEQDGLVFVSENFFEGQSLQQILNSSGSRPERQAAQWMVQLCDIAAALHEMEKPVIFRDIKPDNVILRGGRQICLIDPEAMRLYTEGAGGDELLFMTEGFAAPEQYGGFGQTDERTDVYGIGATLFSLVTGHANPADEPHPGDYLTMLSPGMRHIIEKAMERDPEKRYQTCRAMRSDLADVRALSAAIRRSRGRRTLNRFLGLLGAEKKER